jgi:hypothetical protein
MKKLIILLLIFSAQLIFADNQCVSLFERNYTNSSHLAKINFSSQGPFQENIRVILTHAKPIGDTIKRILRRKANDIINQTDIEKVHTLQEGSYDSIVRESFKKFKVKFDVTYENEKDILTPYLDELNLKFYLIRPNTESPLNRLAKSAFEKYGIRIAYAPALNIAHGFDAAFHSDFNIVLLQVDAILEKNYADPVLLTHELKHAMYEAERRGKFIPKVRAPVHAEIVNRNEINNEQNLYASYVNFEELVTYAVSISSIAKKIEKQRIIGDRLKNSLFNTMNILLEISHRINHESQLAIDILNNNDRSKIKISDSSVSITLSTDHVLTIKAPLTEQTKFLQNPILYSELFLKSAQKLAVYNLNFFNKINPKIDTYDLNSWMNLVTVFKTEQVRFLEKLKLL